MKRGEWIKLFKKNKTNAAKSLGITFSVMLNVCGNKREIKWPSKRV